MSLPALSVCADDITYCVAQLIISRLGSSAHTGAAAGVSCAQAHATHEDVTHTAKVKRRESAWTQLPIDELRDALSRALAAHTVRAMGLLASASCG